MEAISRVRFDALAGYSRSPTAPLLIEELSWHQEAGEKVLGLVALDLPDRDYVSYVLGRDANGRFRAVWLECSIDSRAAAEALLEEKLLEYAELPVEAFHQGDEVGSRTDFFGPVVPRERQHPVFSLLVSDKSYSPARGLIEELMLYFDDVDGNFVQQFQSDGFDARLWELYLYALLTELSFGIDRAHVAPDFFCHSIAGPVAIEATTTNPSGDIDDVRSLSKREYFEHFVPLRFGSALFSKVQKKYWELPHVHGVPLVLAIQDFHAAHSMAWSNSALVEYLYAIRQYAHENRDGDVIIASQAVEEYQRPGKSPIPAGFFLQPGNEYISAVIANPSGTLTKFNRMGVVAGFGDPDIKMIRKGYCYRHDERLPQDFCAEVHAAGYTETWCEGLSIYHNPKAVVPLPRETFPRAAHYTSRDGRILAELPSFHPVGSTTVIVPAE